jgi:hypothetical protein
VPPLARHAEPMNSTRLRVLNTYGLLVTARSLASVAMKAGQLSNLRKSSDTACRPEAKVFSPKTKDQVKGCARNFVSRSPSTTGERKQVVVPQRTIFFRHNPLAEWIRHVQSGV